MTTTFPLELAHRTLPLLLFTFFLRLSTDSCIDMPICCQSLFGICPTKEQE